MQGYAVNLKVDGSDFGYLCTSCGLLLREPRQTPCGHRYCKSCVQELTRSWGGRCGAPECGETIQLSEMWPDKAAEREVLGIAIFCNNAEGGCKWEGVVRQVMDHLSGCDFEKMNCINAGQGCNAQMCRKDMGNHLQYVCQYRHVGEMQNPAAKPGDYSLTSVTELGETRDSRVVGLRNRIDEQERAIKVLMGGTAGMETRMDVVEQAVWDAFDGVGRLNHEVQRMKEEDNSNALIASLQSRIGALERRETEQDAQLARRYIIIKTLEQTSYNGELVWKISCMAQKRHDAVVGKNTAIDSVCFFSRTGYKMRAQVYLNGYGRAEDTHISVFFVMMKGEYDAILPWPFRQQVGTTA
ncbi:TNF receptor-associated factor 3-like [Branchiostoma lanceolatum]|uniref:TNF receptor-associated factor 3-like n=1 Tax=Branchiostoma lanceolatum TaxID=7740 RepID=UPI003453078D